MKQKKKNGFFTFICSFMPGAAEMYMGFMKMGLSIIAIFFLSIMLPAVFRASDVFICLAVIVWFNAFFHARNVVACDEESFALLQDRYIWEELNGGRDIQLSNGTVRKWIAGGLILTGCGILWNNFIDLFAQALPQQVWSVIHPFADKIPQIALAILIIAIGVKMIRGKKELVYGDAK